jgi:hypothetical protein
MSAARSLLLACGALLAAACHRDTAAPPAANNAAVTDIDTLPPDESDATPTNQLVNGDDQPDVNDTAMNGD